MKSVLPSRWTTGVALGLGMASWMALAQTATKLSFDGDRALADVEKLVAFGARPPGSEAHRRAQAFLLRELEATGLEVARDDFTALTPVGPMEMANLIAVHRGTSNQIVILAGHYDTKRFDEFRFVGANDGGSSAAVILELARAVVRLEPPPTVTVWLALLDGEEALVAWSDSDSLYGSRHLAARLEKSGELGRVGAFLLVDMVGDRDLGIERDGYSTPWLQDLVWEEARQLGHGEQFLESTIYVQDDHLPFAQRGVPVVDLIDFRYGPGNTFWHSPEDTPDKLSAASLQAVGETLLSVLQRLDHRLSK